VVINQPSRDPVNPTQQHTLSELLHTSTIYHYLYIHKHSYIMLQPYTYISLPFISPTLSSLPTLYMLQYSIASMLHPAISFLSLAYQFCQSPFSLSLSLSLSLSPLLFFFAHSCLCSFCGFIFFVSESSFSN
jgi:hypothetical protein